MGSSGRGRRLRSGRKMESGVGSSHGTVRGGRRVESDVGDSLGRSGLRIVSDVAGRCRDSTSSKTGS